MYRRLIAALLALWLPLQLGTAFAVSAPMQAAAGAGHHACHGHDATPEGHASGAHVAPAEAPVPIAEAPAPISSALAACAEADSHDAASCVDCAFCFASSIALVLPGASVPQAEASRSAVASRADRFDSRNQVPPDPPPIA
jgi:hypothetical protein